MDVRPSTLPPPVKVDEGGKEQNLLALALTSSLVNDCSCDVCRILRKSQKTALKERIEEVLKDD